MENYTRWDDFLVAEHEMIERAMAVLKSNLEKIDEAVKAPLQMQRAIDFLLVFGDKIHNTMQFSGIVISASSNICSPQ